MNRTAVIFAGVITLIFLLGCSTQFKVVTEPEKASVFLLDAETGERTNLGETPIEKKDEEIREMLGGRDPSQFYTVVVEKEGFETENLWVPISPSGSVTTEIRLKLKTAEQRKKNMDSVDRVLDQIFLAQSFARQQQFERALIEIDTVLEEYPNLARALSMKAAIYYAKKDFTESLRWYEKTIEANPQMEQAIAMLTKVRKLLKLPASQKPPAGQRVSQ